MSQVNVLSIDLPVNSEPAVSKSSAVGNNQTENSAFSEVMARHQEKESGNNGQQYDKHTQTSDKKEVSQDVAKEAAEQPSENTVALDKNVSANDEQAQTSTANESVKQDSEIKVDESITIPKIETDKQVMSAEELLALLTASGKTTTEHQNRNNDQTSFQSETASKIELAEFNIALEQKSKALLADGKLINEQIEASKSPAEATDSFVDGEKSIKLAKSVLSDVGQLKNQQSAVNSDQTANEENIKANKVNKDESSLHNPPENSAAKSIEVSTKESDNSDSLKAKPAKTESEVKTTTSADVNRSTTSKEDVHQAQLTNSADLIDDMTQEQEAGIAKRAELNSTGQVSAINKELSTDKEESKSKLNQPVVNENKTIVLETPKEQVVAAQVSNVTSEQAAQLVKNNQSEKIDNGTHSARIINQPTSPEQLANNTQQSLQQNAQQNSQQEAEQKSAQQGEQLNPELTLSKAEKLDLLSAKENMSIPSNDKVAEKSFFSPAIEESSNRSLSTAQEQSIQQMLAKNNSESITLQSSKNTVNVHNETIAIYRKDFTNAVKEKVMVMINQKLKQLEIRLDPPELGSMLVKVNLQNEQAAVSFIVQNQQAKEALDQNIGKLKDMLAESGVDVGESNVEQQNQQADGQEGFSEQQRGQLGTETQETLDEQFTSSAANLYKASATGVDYYA